MFLVLWLTLPLHTFGFVNHELHRLDPVHPGCAREPGYWDCTGVPAGIYPR